MQTTRRRGAASWPVDTPIVPRVFVQGLIAHVKGNDAHSSYVVYKGEATEALRLPLCGLWSVELAESVSAYLDAGKSSVFGLISQSEDGIRG